MASSSVTVPIDETVIREALEASEEAAHSDGGCGVVKIDGRWCYVQ